MATRTTETTLTFCGRFAFPLVDCPLPAGTYRLAIDEDESLRLSFLAFNCSRSIETKSPRSSKPITAAPSRHPRSKRAPSCSISVELRAAAC